MASSSGSLSNHGSTMHLQQLQVSASLRIAQVAAGVLYCLFSSGIIFGYAALKPVLISEGVYRHLCTPDELASHVHVCRQQELQMNLMFNVAAVVTNAAAFPVGATLDRYGPRVASLIGCLFLLLGAALLAIAPSFPPEAFDAFIPGYVLLALGGPFIFISTFQLSNSFPLNSGLVLSFLTGAFDASSAVFLGYRLMYQSSALGDRDVGRGHISLALFFSIYCSVPFIIAILQLTLMPKESYKSMGELVNQVADEPEDGEGDYDEEEAVDAEETNPLPKHTTSINGIHSFPVEAPQSTERTALLGATRKNSTNMDNRMRRRSSAVSRISTFTGEEATTSAKEQETRKRAISGVWGALHGRTAFEQICTWWFLLVTVFTTLQMLRINYFLATIRPQYEYLWGSWSLAVRLNGFFDLALPIGGLASTPFIGLLLDHTSTVVTLSVLVLFSTLIGVLGIIPSSLPAGYANVVLFVLYRPTFYTAVSDYSAKVFGFRTFGTVYGLIICVSGLFNLVQSGLDSLTVRTHLGNPIPVNTGLMVAGIVIGVTFVVYVGSESIKLRKKRARDFPEAEAEDAEEIMPDPTHT